jgi:hypothetical protein
VRERLGLESLNRALKRGALGVLMRAEAGLAGPPGELTVRGELQRQDLVAGEACRCSPLIIDTKGATDGTDPDVSIIAESADWLADFTGARVSRGARCRARYMVPFERTAPSVDRYQPLQAVRDGEVAVGRPHPRG